LLPAEKEGEKANQDAHILMAKMARENEKGKNNSV